MCTACRSTSDMPDSWRDEIVIRDTLVPVYTPCMDVSVSVHAFSGSALCRDAPGESGGRLKRAW